MSIQEDAFVHRGDTLPDGIERHVDAAPHSAYTDRQVLRAEIAAVFGAATPGLLEAPL